MPIKRLSLLLVCALSLGACQGGMPRFGLWGPEKDAQAESMLKAHDYQGAMYRYEQLARTRSDPDFYWLQAADAALRSGDASSARSLAQLIKPAALGGDDRDQYVLLTARLDLNEGRAQEAMAKLNTLAGSHLEGANAVNYHTLRASAFNQRGDMLGSVRERILLSKLLVQPDAIQHNNAAIYDALGHLPDSALTYNQPPPPDVLGGWMELTHVLKTTPPGELRPAVDQWQARYPAHPANGPFLSEAIVDSGIAASVPRKTKSRSTAAALPKGPYIGVLLPLTGPYAQAANAIRVGMTAAHAADPDSGKDNLHFVDTAGGDVYARYRTLAEGGATAVIGPLVKEDVTALARHSDLSVPVLALNQVSDLANPNLFQFGLTPEQDVEQVAGSAWFDGRQKALVMAPDTAYGKRLTQHFDYYWRSLGGQVANRRYYVQHGGDTTTAVRDLLATDLAGNPFVFLVADSSDAAAILPNLSASTAAGSIPVYATAGVYEGQNDPARQDKLNGLIFCGMPWLLNPGEGGALSAQAMAGQISQTPADMVKLIAMGLDAYRLVPMLGRLKADPGYRWAGATGTLALQSGNHLQRQLECARFDTGGLQRRGTAPLLRPAAAPTR